jgi:hypothetical protein
MCPETKSCVPNVNRGRSLELFHYVSNETKRYYTLTED